MVHGWFLTGYNWFWLSLKWRWCGRCWWYESWWPHRTPWWQLSLATATAATKFNSRDLNDDGERERKKKDHRHFTLLIISQRCTLYRFSKFFLNCGSPWLWGTVRCSLNYPTNQDLVTAPYRRNGISKKTLIVSKYSDRIIFIVYRLESTPTLNSKTIVDPILG